MKTKTEIKDLEEKKQRKIDLKIELADKILEIQKILKELSW